MIGSQLHLKVLDIDYAARHGFKRGYSGLAGAARRTRRYESETRLKKRSSNENTGRTILHEAAKRGNAGVVEHLIAAHLDLDAQDADGNTPLHLAASSGDLPTVRTLLAGNADKTIRNGRGETPEILARKRGWKEVAEQLSRWTSAWDVLKQANAKADEALARVPRKVDNSPAVARAKKLLKCKEAAHGADSTHLTITLSRLSDLLAAEDRFGEAITTLKRAIKITVSAQVKTTPMSTRSFATWEASTTSGEAAACCCIVRGRDSDVRSQRWCEQHGRDTHFGRRCASSYGARKSRCCREDVIKGATYR